MSAGDTIEIGVTHEVVINGDKAWIKLGINSQVLANESDDAAISRVADLVNTKVIEVIEKTVATVTKYEGAAV